MSSITVRQTTQKIVVDAATGAVSVISTGPQGPAGPEGTNGIFFGDDPPLAPQITDLWVNTTNFVLYGYYNDGDSTQWVEIGALDVADIDLPALADSLVPYILNDPDFEGGVGGGDTTPPTVTVSALTHTLNLANKATLTMFDNASQVTVTLPAGTFEDGDWFTLQSTGAGGVTFDTTGLTVVGGGLPDLSQYEGVTVVYSGPNSVTFFGSGGDTTPETATVSTTTHTLDDTNLSRLSVFDNAAAVTVTIPTGTFQNGDWFALQSSGAGGVTFDTTGLTIVGGATVPDLAQYEAVTVIFTAADTITFYGVIAGGGGTPADTTPPAGVISTTTHTLDANDLARLTLFDNAAAVTVTVPTGTFENGDWFTLQSDGAGGVTLDLTGLTVNGGSSITSFAQGESVSIVFTAANTISIIGTAGELVVATEPYNEAATTGAAYNVDMNLSFQKLIMDQNCTFDVTNLAAAGEVKTSYVYITGAFTPTFSANFDWGDAGAPTYSDGMMIVLTSMNGVTTVAAAFSGGGFSV